MDLDAKFSALKKSLAGLESVLVAYSGGVDSAFLAFVAQGVLEGKMRAVIADSPSLARTQLADAIAFAEEQRIALAIVNTSELENPDYRKNDSQRCFHCKDELFKLMEDYRRQHGFRTIAYGVNVDDQGDFRPGQRAAAEHHVAAPLLEAGLTKAEVRELAQRCGLRVWNKPASACLASRLEYGRPVTREALAAVEQGEDAVRALGFTQFRVRHHGAIVRIEIARDEMPRALTATMAAEFARIFKALGFTYVTLDLEGFRSGSMNAMLAAESLTQPR